MADATERSEEQENQLVTSKEFHTAFAFIMGLMLTLVGVEYQGKGKTPFQEHRLMMSMFIMIVLVYAIALVKITLNNHGPHHHNSNSVPSTQATSTGTTGLTYNYIFVISGTIAWELLLYILVTPLKWFLIINGFVSIFAGVLYYSCRRQTDEPLLTAASSSNLAADHYESRVHKLYEWTKQVFSKSPAPNLDPTTEEHAHRTKCMQSSLAYLCLDGLGNCLNIYLGRLCRASTTARTTTIEHEGHGDVQLSNIV